jgi:hypothetical protein
MRGWQEIHARVAAVAGVALSRSLLLTEGELAVDNRSIRTASRGSGSPAAILEHVTDLPIGRVRQQLVWGHAKGFGDDYNLNVGDFPVSSFDLCHSGTINGHAFQLESTGKSSLSPSRLHLRAEVLYPLP